MFTGIIEEVGTVKQASEGVLVISCKEILSSVSLGDSVAVNGIDLTVYHVEEDSLYFNVMPETYRRSNLAGLVPGRSVNLERSLTLSTKISGHLVRGWSRLGDPFSQSCRRGTLSWPASPLLQRSCAM